MYKQHSVFLKEARNTLEKGLPGIYTILEKERATGIIKATVTAVRGAVVHQWKEAFCAVEMGSDLLKARAKTGRAKQWLSEEQVGWLILDYGGDVFPNDRIVK